MNQTQTAEPFLVVMLTNNDMTVENAGEVFESCKGCRAKYWGMKEKGLPVEEMKALYAEMKRAGKRTALEVVAYDEEGGLKGATLARECGCDILMGTKYSARISDYCHANGMSYMPFVGEVEGRPSVLRGTPAEIVAEARSVIESGADGIDLLGYRYEGDAAELIRRVVDEVEAPTCVAGSIDSYGRLGEVAETAPWGFTIGSAFFNHRFGDALPAQIDSVVDYMAAHAPR